MSAGGLDQRPAHISPRAITHAGLDRFFEEVLSADAVKCYKPGHKPYRMAAERLKVAPKDLCVVSTHAWDIEGARAAGLKTAFLARPRKVLNPDGVRLVAKDLNRSFIRAMVD